MVEGSRLDGCGLGEELFDEGGDVAFEFFMAGGVTGAGEACVDFFDEAVAAEEEGGWPAVEVDGLGKLVGELVCGASDEYGVGDAVVGDEGVEALGVVVGIALLEVDVYDLEAAGMEFLVEADEEGCFVVAVGAPGAADGYDDDLAAKLRVGAGDGLSGEIGKAEGEWG